MEKTAMQQLIDWLENTTESQLNALDKAYELLAIEKQNIVDAYDTGVQHGEEAGMDLGGELYFDSAFE